MLDTLPNTIINVARVRGDAAENSDESEDGKNKNRFFNIIIQQ